MGVIVFISGVWGELMCISNFDGAKKTNRTRGRCGRVCITDVCKLLALPCTSSALGALGVGMVEDMPTLLRAAGWRHVLHLAGHVSFS